MQVGVLFLVLAMLLTPAVDGVAKTLATDHSPMEVAFLRYFTAGLIALLIAKASGRRITVHREDRLGMVFRTALIMGAMTALIAALAMVPMAKAVGGFLIAPIVSGLLSAILFREALTVPRLVGSCLSVAGAYVLMAPEAGIELGSMFALLGGALLGAYLAATRGAKATDALSTLAVQCLLGSAMLAPFAFWNGGFALSWTLVGGALALGGISALCHFLTVAAYARAEATVLAPFLYFNMISAMAVGFFFFGETVSGGNLVALAAIAFGGLVTLMKGDLGLGAVLRLIAPQPATAPAVSPTAIPTVRRARRRGHGHGSADLSFGAFAGAVQAAALGGGRAVIRPLGEVATALACVAGTELARAAGMLRGAFAAALAAPIPLRVPVSVRVPPGAPMFAPRVAPDRISAWT
jgi:drug/metabolite transporter (DMT)-like permease